MGKRRKDIGSQIIGKTLEECLDDINKKLDNHVTSIEEKYDLLDNRVIEMGIELKWVKYISLLVLGSVITLTFTLVAGVFV